MFQFYIFTIITWLIILMSIYQLHLQLTTLEIIAVAKSV